MARGKHANRSVTTLPEGAARLRVVKHFADDTASRYELRAPRLYVYAETIREKVTRAPRQLHIQIRLNYRVHRSPEEQDGDTIEFYGRPEVNGTPDLAGAWAWHWRMGYDYAPADLILERYSPLIDWFFALDAQRLPVGDYTVADAPLHVFAARANPAPEPPVREFYGCARDLRGEGGQRHDLTWWEPATRTAWQLTWLEFGPGALPGQLAFEVLDADRVALNRARSGAVIDRDGPANSRSFLWLERAPLAVDVRSHAGAFASMRDYLRFEQMRVRLGELIAGPDEVGACESAAERSGRQNTRGGARRRRSR